jgi:deoxyribonuclease (pyrimidine dimer)
MVRVNLIQPKYLTDQHLIAEYAEILILLSYVKKYPKEENIPKNYCLGTGHMVFFKNKLKYLKKRHDFLIKEMKHRGFKPKKSVNLNEFDKKLCKDWKHNKKDLCIIKKRIIQRINLKPSFYKYYRKNKSKKFYDNLIKNAK